MTQLIRIIASATLIILAACGDASNTTALTEKTVNVYNWADAVAPGVIEQFEAETGIKVNYDTYASTANVEVKLLTGNSGYDVIFHSNLLASRIMEVGVFQKIDREQLPNLKNLDPETMRRIDIYASVRGYNIPYHWGTTGFTWNVDMVRERLPDQDMESAAVLFDPQVISQLADCGISFFDEQTSLMPMALSYLGLDPNTDNPDDLAAVQELMLRVRPYVRYFSNDKYLSDIPNKELCVAMAWSGDYANALDRAKEANIEIDLAYSVPKEGAGLWVDGIYIPSDAPHVKNAHVFLNFLLRGDIAFRNSDYSKYATPNGAAWTFLDEEVRDNPAIYPDEEIMSRSFRVDPKGPMQARARTRVLARVKSGL